MFIMPFICYHCGKHLLRQQRLDSHIAHFHKGEDGKPCHDEESSTTICPEKYCSADMSGVAGFSGSPPYIEPLERNQGSQWTEKDVDVDIAPKKKKSNWGISLKEYKKKMRLADKVPSVWEQSTGTDLVRPLLQVGGGAGKEWDIFQDAEGDDQHSESGDSQESDREEEEDSDSSDVNENDGEKDPDWVFNFLIYHSKNNLKKDGGYDLKTLRKTFRINYGNILKWMHALRQNKIHKKVMCTAEDLRNSSADFDYDESIDAAIAKRKYLLDRLVTEEDLSDSEDDLSDSEDELSAMGEDRDSDTD